MHEKHIRVLLPTTRGGNVFTGILLECFLVIFLFREDDKTHVGIFEDKIVLMTNSVFNLLFV